MTRDNNFLAWQPCDYDKSQSVFIDGVTIKPILVPLGKVLSQLVRDGPGLHADVRAAPGVAEVGSFLSAGAVAQ